MKTCAVLTPRLGQSLVPIMARLQWLSGSNPENCAETFSFRITWVRGGDWRQKPEPKLLCRYRLSSTWPSRQSDYQLSQRKLSSSLSSLDRSGRHDAHPMESRLQRLERREWWLWLSALVVTILSGTVFLLSSFPSLFLHSDRFFEIGSDQARGAILGLMLLFNICLVYRQWSFDVLAFHSSDNGVNQALRALLVITPAGSTGRCNTLLSVDPIVFFKQTRSFGLYSIKPKQGSVFFESALSNEFSHETTADWTSGRCCVDPLRPPLLSPNGNRRKANHRSFRGYNTRTDRDSGLHANRSKL